MRIFADDIDAIVLQMIKIRLFLLLLIAGTLQGFAQRRLVVVDVETLIPVVGANVIISVCQTVARRFLSRMSTTRVVW